MKNHKHQRKPRRQKPQRLQVTFLFKPIDTNNLHVRRGNYNHSTRKYKRFTKRCFGVLEEKGFKRGCLDLRGDLVLTMEIGVSDHKLHLSNCTKGILGTLVQFFGGWDAYQVQEMHIKKVWVDDVDQEYFNVLITKNGRN